MRELGGWNIEPNQSLPVEEIDERPEQRNGANGKASLRPAPVATIKPTPTTEPKHRGDKQRNGNRWPTEKRTNHRQQLDVAPPFRPRR